MAEAFFAQLRELHPDVQIVTHDVWSEDLPELDRLASGARYIATRGLDLDEAAQAAAMAASF